MAEEQSAILVRNLCKRFGKREVLRGLELEVPQGSVFGLLGVNGAGKTTLIRILLGLLRADSGSCRVAGLDPTRDPIGVRLRTGYMAENQTMYGWMRVGKLIRWVGRFYPAWDAPYAEQLREQMGLDPKQKVGVLSKGQTSRLALLLALAQRPELVILDDPTLGLDPIARRDFLRDVIGHLQGAGVTVFFSSHLLYEVAPICDRVAILHEGAILRSGEVDAMRSSVKRILVGADAQATLALVPGVLDIQSANGRYALIVERAEEAIAVLREAGSAPLEVQELNLDEIFEAHVIGSREIPDG